MSQPNYPYQGDDQQPPAAPQYGSPAQPQYGSPQYGSPQYGAPQYGGPQYGAPPPQYPAGDFQYPGQVQPPGPPAAPPKKSNVGKIILIVLAVLVVLCAGGGVAAYFLLRDEVAVATQTRVVAPETLAGRPKISQPELQAATAQMEAELKTALPNATSTVSGFYGDLATQDLVMIVAVSGVVADPDAEVDEAMSTAGLNITNVKDVDPGPLGGSAKCGDGSSEGVDVGVCTWADRGSLGMIVMFNKSGDDVASEFVTMRGQIEQQG
jgi:hypothetical protein